MQALELIGTFTGLVYLYFEYRASIWLWAASIVMPAIYIFVYYDAGFYADMSINVYYLLASGYGWAMWMRRGRRNRRFAVGTAGSTGMTDGEPAWKHSPDPADGTAGPHSPVQESQGQPAKTGANCHTVPDCKTKVNGEAEPHRKEAPGSNTQGPKQAEPNRRTGPERKNGLRPISPMPAGRWLPLGAIAATLFGAIAFVLIRFTDSTVPYGDSFTTALSIVGMWMLAQKYVEQWLVWIAVDVVCAGLYFYKGLYPTACLYALYAVIAVFGYFKWLRMMKNENAYA